MKLKLEFNLILGQDLESIPAPVIKPGAELPPPPPGDRPRGILKIPQTILLTEENGVWSGLYQHPHWGELPATEVSVAENHIAFTAPSGNDDKGGHPALFNFAFTRSDTTDSVVGFAGGREPFFRSYLPVEGIVTVQE